MASPLKKGKLIVIEGTDGSGKGTQFSLLVERMQKHGIPVVTFDFPRYGAKACGPVEEYLNGVFGSANEVGAYRGSVFFAVDRYAASFEMKKALEQGAYVLCNRYVASNIGHQGGKIVDPVEKEKYIRWVEDLEYGIFGIPRPDLNIILHVPPEISQQLVDNKEQRNYLGDKKRDIHEEDISHLLHAEQVYLEMAKRLGAKLIECAPQGKLMSISDIQEIIWDIVMSFINEGS